MTNLRKTLTVIGPMPPRPPSPPSSADQEMVPHSGRSPGALVPQARSLPHCVGRARTALVVA